VSPFRCGGELGIGLVDDHDPRRVRDASPDLGGLCRRPGRVVRRAQIDDPRPRREERIDVGGAVGTEWHTDRFESVEPREARDHREARVGMRHAFPWRGDRTKARVDEVVAAATGDDLVVADPESRGERTGEFAAAHSDGYDAMVALGERAQRGGGLRRRTPEVHVVAQVEGQSGDRCGGICGDRVESRTEDGRHARLHCRAAAACAGRPSASAKRPTSSASPAATVGEMR
jgi:hypothetical protein